MNNFGSWKLFSRGGGFGDSFCFSGIPNRDGQVNDGGGDDDDDDDDDDGSSDGNITIIKKPH